LEVTLQLLIFRDGLLLRVLELLQAILQIFDMALLALAECPLPAPEVRC